MDDIDIFAAAARWPTQIALETETAALSFAELAALVEARLSRVAAALGSLDPSKPVAWVARASVDGVALFLGLASRRIPVSPLHAALTEEERDAHIALIRPAGLIDGDRVTVYATQRDSAETDADCEAGQRRPERGESDTNETPLAILFTSGTSSQARPLILSRRAFTESAAASAQRLGWSEHDKWLLMLPLAHIGGLSILTRCLLAGRTIALPSAPSNTLATIAFARSREVTLVSLVPAQLVRWLAADDSGGWPSLRAVLVGGAATAPELVQAARRRGIPVLRTYGLTETCSQVATELPDHPGTAATDCGPPLAGYDVRSSDGRLEILAPSLYSGTWPMGKAIPESGGWLRTNDRGWVDDRGHVHVAGRCDDVVVTGGENVDLREVESCMSSCLGVRQLCAIGLPDDTWGAVIAILVEGDLHATPTTATLARHARRHLASHKRPRRWFLVDQLPMTRSGKIDRKAASQARSWITIEYHSADE